MALVPPLVPPLVETLEEEAAEEVAEEEAEEAAVAVAGPPPVHSLYPPRTGSARSRPRMCGCSYTAEKALLRANY